MCGIMGYVNHRVEKSRGQIIQTLLEALGRLDYRGYDSTGLVVDGDEAQQALPFKVVGKVADLKRFVEETDVDLNKTFPSHIGLAHTRWAANGKANIMNCHPISSDATWRFSVVHNGIVTNYRAVRDQLVSQGYQFDGDTDTEVIAKLALRLYDENPAITFRDLGGALVRAFQGAFSFLLKSRHYPNEVIAARNGLPLVVGFKSADHEDWFPESFPVETLHYQASELLSTRTGLPNGDGMDDHQTGRHHFNGANFSNHLVKPVPVEFFLSSDPAAIAKYTDKMIFLEDNEMAHIHDSHLDLLRCDTVAVDQEQSAALSRPVQIMADLDWKTPSKEGFNHYMRKEISEQPQVVEDAIQLRLSSSGNNVTFEGFDRQHLDKFRRHTNLVFVACGSSYYSCLAVQSLFEELTDFAAVSVEVASEFLDKPARFHQTGETGGGQSTAFVFVSQSGETAECLRVLANCRDAGCFTVGVVNVAKSSVARLCDCVVYIGAGTEIGVATTKAYTGQFVHLVLLALALGGGKGGGDASNGSTTKLNRIRERRGQIIDALRLLPDQMRTTLRLVENQIRKLCDSAPLSGAGGLMVLGRGYQYATALEAALKIKEVAYVHCEAVLSGELKHGVLALVDDDLPVVMIATRDRSFERTLNSHEQLISHGSIPIMLCNSGETAFQTRPGEQIEIIRTVDCLQGILNVIPLQLMAYWMGVSKGNDIDFPRNVAKSVTVE
ncbi:glutamine:fructose-6-phosphate amidotransferase [Xylaria arbuscula]|nr:glutamine:fructose-6-phosphate amidotransferase [Xylaria arbuscula]